MWAIMFIAFAVIVLLLPETIRAARLAGEEQPVPTVERKEAAAKTVEPKPATVRPAVPAVTPPAPATAPPAAKAAAPPAQTPSVPSPPPATSATKTGGTPGDTAPPGEAAPKPSAAKPPASPEAVKTAAASPVLQKPQSQPALPPQPPQSRPATAISQTGKFVTIDFDNVDIRVFIKFVSELTGRNFLLDDRVKGKVTIISPRKIAVDEVYNVLQSILEIYGFTTVDAGEVVKVLPSVEARGKNTELRLKQEPINPEDKIVTQLLQLQHASPDEMKKILDPLISKSSAIFSYPPAGMLIITDTLSNIKRLQEIVSALDVEGAVDELSYIPLQAAAATEVVKALNAMFTVQRVAGAVAQIKAVADERTNAIILMARPQATLHVKKLITLMDKEVPQSAGALNVYRLQNANAEDLVKVLMNIPKETAKDAKQAGAATPLLSKDVSVLADKATNTLIITANRDEYRTLEGVIRQLDMPRPMVYIEALIMEVSVKKNFNIGVEWQLMKDVGSLASSGLGSSSTAVGTAGFSSGSSLIPQVNSTTGAVTMPTGFSLGVVGAGITIGGITFPNIGAILQAYQTDSDVSILSTPQLLTLNNEDAEINVGKNVPYITRSDTSTTATTVYGQSYEYKDVGLIMKLTPHINEEKFVRLKIDQQYTQISGTQTATPTTLKRAAKTTVVVKDKETVVIGGLIDDTNSVETNKVPLLGDIPLLGWLFKSRTKSRDKTNLYIFITPHIVRNQDDASAIYRKKLEGVGDVEEGIIRMDLNKSLTKPSAERKE